MSRHCVVIRTDDGTFEKHHRDVSRWATEVAAYRTLTFAAPRMLGARRSSCVDGCVAVIVTEAATPSDEIPGWSDVDGLADLLMRVHEVGWAHRDLHWRNVVRADDGRPLLIDWELATNQADRSMPPYDLFGSGPSGVDRPATHWQDHYWDVDAVDGIGRRWGPHNRLADACRIQ